MESVGSKFTPHNWRCVRWLVHSTQQKITTRTFPTHRFHLAESRLGELDALGDVLSFYLPGIGSDLSPTTHALTQRSVITFCEIKTTLYAEFYRCR